MSDFQRRHISRGFGQFKVAQPMTERKPPQPPKKSEVSLVRSSAAEYLSFVAASGQGGVEAVQADESIWLTQKMLGLLYDVNVRTVNEHLKKIFADSELLEDSVVRKFRITASDGKHYHTLHYQLPAIIAVGYKVNSERAVQFRVQDRLFESDFDRLLKQVEAGKGPARDEE